MIHKYNPLSITYTLQGTTTSNLKYVTHYNTITKPYVPCIPMRLCHGGEHYSTTHNITLQNPTV